jgi:hypothetical protein
MASKKQSQHIHVRRRFNERYGVILNDEMHRLFVLQIQQGRNAVFHCPQSNRVSIWLVNVDKKFIPGSTVDVDVPMVYDKERKQIVSVLPPSCVDVNKIGLYEI